MSSKLEYKRDTILSEEICKCQYWDPLPYPLQVQLSPMKRFFDINDLNYFHRIVYGQIPINLPEYIQPYNG